MNEQIIDYLHYLTIERGLSENTKTNYRRDLEKYLAYLTLHQVPSWQAVDRFIVIDFLQELKEEKKSPATLARMITSLRQFHQFLRQERFTDHNPMQHIELPKKAQKLPDILSLSEVEQLIETPDTNEILGIRDRAILEVLYATGLRVSELVGLRLEDLHLSMGLLKTIGKGDKERIVCLLYTSPSPRD